MYMKSRSRGKKKEFYKKGTEMGKSKECDINKEGERERKFVKKECRKSQKRKNCKRTDRKKDGKVTGRNKVSKKETA